MRTLYLLRHAKSSWNQPGLRDHARPLAPRGVRAARAMARYMEREGLGFDRVICSSAARARQTCELALSDLALEPLVTPDLYMATPRGMLRLVQSEAEAASRVLLVGHNPGMEELAGTLCGAGDPRLLNRIARKYPTAALAEIAFDALSWSEVRPGTGRLLRFVRPKDLPEAEAERL